MHYVFQGFGDKLLSEVKKLAPKDIKIRVSILIFCYNAAFSVATEFILENPEILKYSFFF